MDGVKSLGTIERQQQISVMEQQIGRSQEKLLYHSVKCKPDCSQSQENRQTNLLEKTPSIDLNEVSYVQEKESSSTLEEKSNLISENASMETTEKYQYHIFEKQPGHNPRVQENQIRIRKPTHILEIPRISYEDKTQLSPVLKNYTKLVLDKQLDHISEDKHKFIPSLTNN